ncbi:MAG: hypothetical protein IPJ80_14285 [Saprospiraceae bacterium]|nr:hypothetical protein [Saprospiraceae bacterium]
MEGTINSIGSDALSLLQKPQRDCRQYWTTSVSWVVRGVSISGWQTSAHEPEGSQQLLQTCLPNKLIALISLTIPELNTKAGNAGIIDIRVKKTATLGTNGTVDASYIRGKYPEIQCIRNRQPPRNKNLDLFGTLGAVMDRIQYREVSKLSKRFIPRRIQ